MAYFLSLLPPLLSSLVDVECECVCSHGKGEVLVFDLARLTEASVFILSLWPPSLCLLGVDMNSLARCCGETRVLVFDLAVVAKALMQFEHPSEVLVFDLDAS